MTFSYGSFGRKGNLYAIRFRLTKQKKRNFVFNHIGSVLNVKFII